MRNHELSCSCGGYFTAFIPCLIVTTRLADECLGLIDRIGKRCYTKGKLGCALLFEVVCRSTRALLSYNDASAAHQISSLDNDRCRVRPTFGIQTNCNSRVHLITFQGLLCPSPCACNKVPQWDFICEPTLSPHICHFHITKSFFVSLQRQPWLLHILPQQSLDVLSVIVLQTCLLFLRTSAMHRQRSWLCLQLTRPLLLQMALHPTS